MWSSCSKPTPQLQKRCWGVLALTQAGDMVLCQMDLGSASLIGHFISFSMAKNTNWGTTSPRICPKFHRGVVWVCPHLLEG